MNSALAPGPNTADFPLPLAADTAASQATVGPWIDVEGSVRSLRKLALAVVAAGALVAASVVPLLIGPAMLADSLAARLGKGAPADTAVVLRQLPGNTRVLAASSPRCGRKPL